MYLYAKGEITHVLSQLDKVRKIDRILAHEETGHSISYARDRRVRKWCAGKHIKFIEFVQTVLLEGLRIEIISLVISTLL